MFKGLGVPFLGELGISEQKEVIALIYENNV